MKVQATPGSGFEAGLSWNAWVSAADTVSIIVCNHNASPVDPANRTWYVMLTGS